MAGNYSNQATSDNPALIVYLLDISGSMGKSMPGGKIRIQVVKEALLSSIQEMVGRSTKQDIVRPRYRIAMYAYSDDVYDIFDGIKTVDVVSEMGIPDVDVLNRTNPVAGFTFAKELIENDIKSWSDTWLSSCPAPLIVHMTDAEVAENNKFGDPLPIIKQIQNLKVPDGNVLVENIYITDEIQLPTNDIMTFGGYQPNTVISNPLGMKLLSMSSTLPESFREMINKQQGLHLEPNTLMMYPGNSPEFVKVAFAIGGVSGVSNTKRKKNWEDE